MQASTESKTWPFDAIVLALLTFAFILVVYRGTDPWTADLADLGPAPDSPEYLLVAQALVREGTFYLSVNGEAWPSRYPPLMAVLIAPLYLLFDYPYEVAAVVPILAGAGMIASGFLLMRSWFGGATGVLFAAFLATSPWLIANSFGVMTEPLSVCMAFVIALLFTKQARGRASLIERLLMGILLGALILLRVPSVIVIAAAVVALAPYWLAWRPRAIVEIALPCFGVASLLLLYNALIFGHPLKTGYDYHLGTSFFSAGYIQDNLEALRALLSGEVVSILAVRWAALAFGLPLLAAAGLVILGRQFGWKPVFAVCSFVVLTTFPLLFYGFVDIRLRPSIVIGCYALASIAMGVTLLPFLRRYIGYRLSLLAVVVAIVAWPGFGSSSAYAFMETYFGRGGRAENAILLEQVRAVVASGSSPAVLLSDIYLPLAYERLGGSVAVRSLTQPSCFAECDRDRPDLKQYKIEDLVASGRVLFSDAQSDVVRFDDLCQQWSQLYAVRRVDDGRGRWRLFEVTTSEGARTSPPNPCAS